MAFLYFTGLLLLSVGIFFIGAVCISGAIGTLAGDPWGWLAFGVFMLLLCLILPLMNYLDGE